MLKNTHIFVETLVIVTGCLISSNIMVLAGSPEFNQCIQKFSDYHYCLMQETDRVIQESNNAIEQSTYVRWMTYKENCLNGDNNDCINLGKLKEDFMYGRNIHWASCEQGDNQEQCIRRYVGQSYRGLP